MNRKRILVVDDEPDFRELVTYILTGEGYEVIPAADGLEALQQARQVAPDLIILDLMLPELDGLSVCEILRRHPDTARIPVIFVTACTSEPLRQYGLQNGANCYLTKPVKQRELLQWVQSILLGSFPAQASATAGKI